MNINQNQWQCGNKNNGINNFGNGLIQTGNNMMNLPLNSRTMNANSSNQVNFSNQNLNNPTNYQNMSNQNNYFSNMNGMNNQLMNNLNMLNMKSMMNSNNLNMLNQFNGNNLMNNQGIMNNTNMNNIFNQNMNNQIMNNMNMNYQNMNNQNMNNMNMNNQNMNNINMNNQNMNNINMNNMNIFNQNMNNQNMNNINMNNQNMNNQNMNNINMNDQNMNDVNTNNQNMNNISNQNINNINMNNPNMINLIPNNNKNISQSNQNNSNQNNMSQMENLIDNNYQCMICNNIASDPKMCKYCKSIFCQNCISSYLNKQDNYCICNKKTFLQELLNPPFPNNINVKLQEKNNNFKKGINQNGKQIFNSGNNNRINNLSIINEENEENKSNLCQKHNKKIDYYCVQCNKYYCSECLLFFSSEVKNHKGHLILQISKMEDTNVKMAIEEYRKIPNTNNLLEDLMGLCNLKLRENEIKKYEISNFMNLIKNLYLKKIDEEEKELNNTIACLKKHKELIESKIGSIPNGFNNIVNNNDYVQGGLMSKDLKKFNEIDRNLEQKIQENELKNSRLFIENFETDYLIFNMPNNTNFFEGQELFNKNMNIIPGFPSKLIIKYLGNKIFISFSIDINLPLNSPNYPKFFTYITFKNGKYGLEFINLSNQLFPQNSPNQNNEMRMVRQQVNITEIDAKQFSYLAEIDNMIKLKIFIAKTYYKN